MFKDNPKIEIFLFGVIGGGLLAYGSWVILGFVISMVAGQSDAFSDWFLGLSHGLQMFTIAGLASLCTAYSILEYIDRKLKKQP